jgi:hypothetical protein
MKVWKNASIIPILHEIMLTNTLHYQTDFEIDKKILRNAAKSRHSDEKKLLWMSRSSGTHCLREREVFIKDTSAIILGRITRSIQMVRFLLILSKSAIVIEVGFTGMYMS